ncbi:MAG: exopolyphosphatase [Desulfobacteraceae bacterium]|nr:MAG: exopolyphosphatase [Desulfobacteraceae bacterium]
MQTRIITRPDFDGVACAVLLKRALGEATPVVWTQPNHIQSGQFKVQRNDVVANLPLSGEVALWFDHHVSNTTDIPYEGLFRIAPSAAHLVYDYFQDKMEARQRELVRQADKIDAAQLTLDEILHPEHNPYVLLSMTIFGGRPSNDDYCDHLVDLLGTATIDQVMSDPLVRRRCEEAAAANKAYEAYLRRCTTLQGHVSITDFRDLAPVPDGNRFLVYSLFPEACVNAKLYHDGPQTVIKLGHSILNRCCRVNVGKLLSRYDGGGHRGAGAARFGKEEAGRCIDEIITVLMKNEPDVP